MGLDMYLNGNIYTSRNDWKAFDSLPYEEQTLDSVPVTPAFQAIAEAAGVADFVDNDSVGLSVSFTAGYWRKQNAIHNWFVNKLANGVDECQEMYVSREDLEHLKTLCQLVLTVPVRAEEILPTGAGFFFGSTDYDEWYFRGLEKTIGIIDRCLSMPDHISFSYQASW